MHEASRLRGRRSVCLALCAGAMAALSACAAAAADDWIDLGDEGATLWVAADVEALGEARHAEFALATAGGEQRIRVRLGDEGRVTVWVYGHAAHGQMAHEARKGLLVVRVVSHSDAPDQVAVRMLPHAAEWPDEALAEWDVVNDGGRSDANLALATVSPEAAAQRVTRLRVAPTWEALAQAPVIKPRAQDAPAGPDLSMPDPASNPTGGLMLDLPHTGRDMGAIDYDRLPVLDGEHAVVSLGSPEWKFRLHNYLAWYDGRFWCIWSHGPDIEELPAQHVQYSTSRDGLTWEEPMVLAAPPDEKGFGWIARGLWLRDGELIALASKFRAPGFAGAGLSLHAFKWNKAADRWDHAGMVRDDSMNNFAPKKLPDGRWMMTRRDGKRDVTVMIGGTEALDEWDVLPLASYANSASSRPEEPYWYVLPDGKSIVGLFRNNSGKDLLRAFSTDNGRTWSPLVHTNFPDARSKFNAVRTSRGYYVLISNANPARRNPLCLSVSKDGLVYTGMARLPVPQTVGKDDWALNPHHNDTRYESYQYPHVIEHDGTLYVAYSRRKQTVEVLRITLDEVESKLSLERPGAPNLEPPDPVNNPQSRLMLDLPGTGTDPTAIDYGRLRRVPADHAMISDVRDREGAWVHQHAYVAHHGGRYWAMWSDGPGVAHEHLTAEQHRNVPPHHDRAGTRVSYAVSDDGLNWSKPMDLSGPPRIDGFGWIARGLWDRDGELLALASHFNAPGYAGPGLSLEAFRYDEAAGAWTAHGTVLDDALNNFAPKKLPSGQWMMSRRNGQRQLSVMIGGVDAFDSWKVREVSSYGGKNRPEEPYWYVLPDGRSLVGLLRDNAGSKRLRRMFSTDNGETWSPMVTTNFPDAMSKFFALRTSRGYYALVSNSSPAKRDPLTLAISRDGLVYTHLFYLIGGRHIDYPHMIEHDGHLLIAFSGAKQTMEVLRVALDDIDQLISEDAAE